MSRYIKIDTSLIKTVSAGGLSAKALWKRIMQQPSIDICFCRECVKHNTHRCHMAFDLIATEDDDFCSYGEREGE